MPRLTLLAVLLLAAPARTTPVVAPGTACEPFVDPREIRLRVPDRVVTGRIAGGSLREPDDAPLDVGQQIIFGTATLDASDGSAPIPISYIYVRAGGCHGWQPGQGGRFTFDLLDDHARDGALRVMRYAPAPR